MGSNIAPSLNIKRGLVQLARNYALIKQSAWMRTRAVSITRPQPMFVNMGCLFITQHSQSRVINVLKKIESSLGRSRQSGDMPRTLDLDLLVWNDHIIDEDIYSRDFLRIIIVELMPQLAIPLARQRQFLLAQVKTTSSL